MLREGGLVTLLFDLLTFEEGEIDQRTRELRFDIQLLASRVVGATDWLVKQPFAQNMNIGYFGSRTGAAALIAASRREGVVDAVVSRAGRPDLASPRLGEVQAPTLLIVGGNDQPVIQMNRQAMEQMQAILVGDLSTPERFLRISGRGINIGAKKWIKGI
jgi:putative phosphoribosyl transferase